MDLIGLFGGYYLGFDGKDSIPFLIPPLHFIKLCLMMIVEPVMLSFFKKMFG